LAFSMKARHLREGLSPAAGPQALSRGGAACPPGLPASLLELLLAHLRALEAPRRDLPLPVLRALEVQHVRPRAAPCTRSTGAPCCRRRRCPAPPRHPRRRAPSWKHGSAPAARCSTRGPKRPWPEQGNDVGLRGASLAQHHRGNTVVSEQMLQRLLYMPCQEPSCKHGNDLGKDLLWGCARLCR